MSMSERLALRILSIVWGSLVLPSCGTALFSGMIFDAPSSTGNVFVHFIFWSLFTAPLTLLVACIGGLIFSFGKNSENKIWQGRLFALLPFLNVAVLIAGIVLLQIFCGGSTTCQ